MPFVLTGSPNTISSNPFYVGVWLTSRAIAYACMFALIHSYQARMEIEPTPETSDMYTSLRSHHPENRFWYAAYQRFTEAKAYFTILVAMAMYVLVLSTFGKSQR